MKIIPMNKMSFKASLCTNFEFKDKKSNFWPGLVDFAKINRREEVLQKLEDSIRDVYENTDDDIILALEKYENSLPRYILAAYDSEEKIIEDRKNYTKNWFDDCAKRINDLNSITKSGIHMVSGGCLIYSDGSRSHKTFNDIVDMVIYILEEFKNKDSKVYKSLVGNRSRNLSSEVFIRQFGKKIK